MFVNGYLSAEQFEEIFLDNIFDFEKLLEDYVYIEIISTNFTSQKDVVSLKNYLRAYLISNYTEQLNNTNDAEIEKIIESNRQDATAEILREDYKKNEVVYIECKNVKDFKHFIYRIKIALNISENCGNNLDAINDY